MTGPNQTGPPAQPPFHTAAAYTLAVKEMAGDPARTKRMAQEVSYPPLENAKVSDVSQVFTDQQARPYHYVYRPGEVFIFSVSDKPQHPIEPGDDPIDRHWLATLKV